MCFTKDHRLSTKIFDNKLFSAHVKAMRLAGYILDETQNFELWHFWRSAFITLMISIFCALEFGKLIINEKGSAMCLATAFLYLTTSIAYINLFLRRKRLARMLEFLQNDMDRLSMKSDESEEEIAAESFKYMHFITMCIFMPCVAAGTIVYADSFYRFCFHRDGIFDYDTNETDAQALLIKLFPFREIHNSLLIGYVFPLLSFFLGLIAIPLWPTFITGLMTYVNLKWKIIHKRMSEMDISKVVLDHNESAYYSFLATEDDKINFMRTRLCKFCVNEQLRIRWFVHEIQELIYIPVFADFVICSIVICFIFYEMVSGNPSKMDFPFMCIYLFVLASILWLYHWHGTLVKENSDYLRFAIYSCDWYNYPNKVRKMIHQIMISTSYTLEIKAVFISLNLTTFIDIIRAAYSYFSILKNSRNTE